jgi:flagellar hook assembly protein FlgD
VRLAIFDLAGRRVATLADGVLPSGYRTAAWNGTADDGTAVSSGVYFARVEANGETATRKVLLIR